MHPRPLATAGARLLCNTFEVSRMQGVSETLGGPSAPLYTPDRQGITLH